MRRVVIRTIALVAVLLVADAGWVAFRANTELHRARDELEIAAQDLTGGRLEDASTSFAAARDSSGAAIAALHHPAAALAALLPWIGDDTRAVRDLADAGQMSAEAGTALVAAARTVGWTGSGFVDLPAGQLIPVDRLQSAVPQVEQAVTRLVAASDLVSKIHLDGLLGPVRDAVEQGRRTLADRASVAEKVTDLARLVPSMLGSEGTRRYLVVFQNLSSPRGSGGFIGAYALLTASNGAISLSDVAAARQFPTVPPVPAPDADYADRYSVFGGLTHLKASNYSPDFPTSARVMLEIWSAGGGEPVDGVIAVDPVCMSYLLVGSDPVVVPDMPEPIAAGDVVDVLSHDVFLLPGAQASDRGEASIAGALWNAALQRVSDPRALVTGTARAVRERHLQMYAVDPGEQQTIARLGADGSVTLGADALLVSWADAVDARTGYFAQKTVADAITLQTDGSARATTVLTLSNGAPDGPRSILLGDGLTGDPIGFYRALASVYLPTGAVGIQTKIAVSALQFTQTELGHRVWMGELEAPAGASTSASVSYRWPDAVQLDGDEHVFQLELVPQPALRPDQVTIEVTLPAGATIVSASPNVQVVGSTVHYEGSPVVPETVWVRFRA